ncbi:MAG TPA: acyl-homoserine-lactone synthase [Afifellaceae bacterium]|nr:acyl-homoserine-lactone synthase [Afifellaceae bacterium]
MLHVHVVAANNRKIYREELESFFQWRHKVYVEQKGWLPPSADGRERDQFDNDGAVYLLAMDDGALAAGTRLIPSDRPHLLSEVFPQLAAVKGVPRSPLIAEWTRMFVVPGRRGGLHTGACGQMCCAVMEYLLEEGAAQVGGVQELYWLPRWHHYGWRVHPLGLPEEIGRDWCVAAYFDVTEEALAGVRAAAGVDRNLIVRRGSPQPFLPDRSLRSIGLRRGMVAEMHNRAVHGKAQ